MQFPGIHVIKYYSIYNTVILMMIIIQTIKTVYIEDLVYSVGRWLIRKTLIRTKTTFSGHPESKLQVLINQS